MRFTRELLCMSGGAKAEADGGDCEGGVDFDVFDIHPYTTGGPTHKGGPNDVESATSPSCRRCWRRPTGPGGSEGKLPQTPLWVAEFSWDSNPPDLRGLPMKI